MPDKALVFRLVEEVLDSGRSPEEVCASRPELLDEVRERLGRLHRVRGALDALFPEPDPARPGRPGRPLPTVPGHELEAVLGRGGMGVVYKARHVRLNRPVAVKMMLGAAGPRDLVRFRREAEALAELGHPNVVRVHEAGEVDGVPYFTMELVEGGTLAEQLAGVPQPTNRAAALALTLASAVQSTHDRGIVHRDLKPSNILLTRDGAPKISDFGLARRLCDEAGLTRTGTVVGTPSYMAPEQAGGRAEAVGPAADVYALGAILYECLTGRPPFRADSAAATLHQVLTQDPVPPARLNGAVPRDLDTICLKCLGKEPALRYPTAAGLVGDLTRFLNGEPISARPLSRVRRLLRRVRRRPVLSAAVVGVTVSIACLVGAVLWTLSDRAAARRAAAADRAATERAADTDLAEMAARLRAFNWPQARAALERARGRLGERSPADLHRRVDQGTRDLELVDRLDEIRLNRLEWADRPDDARVPLARVGRSYEAAFAEAGFGAVLSDPAAAVDLVAASDICGALVAALDDWALSESGPRLARILGVARRADPDPTGWRDRARDPTTWGDATTISALIESARPNDQPVALLVAVAARSLSARGDPTDYLMRVQGAHPGDFWANHYSGMLLVGREPREAVRFLQAARALRPGAAGVHANLGGALRLSGRVDEAIECYTAALRIDPRRAKVHSNLGNALLEKGRTYDGMDQYSEALRFDPDNAVAHRGLGLALFHMARLDVAIDHHRRSVHSDPDYALARASLGLALSVVGDRDGAIAELREAVRLDPHRGASHAALGNVLRLGGLFEEAKRALQRAQTLLKPEDTRRAVVARELKQCDRLLALEKRLPAVLRGADRPNVAEEAQAFAELCHCKKQYATAARYFAVALDAAPGPTADGSAEVGFDAARAAVLAAQGAGVAALAPGDPERSALRRRALGWLRAEYKALVIRRAAGVKDWQTAVRDLRVWRLNADLAAVREPLALAQLPADERADWRALWADVETVAAQDPFMTVDQARAYAARREWARAAGAYAQMVRHGPPMSGEVLFEYSAVQLLSGDEPGYRATCELMLDRAAKASVRGYHAARACTLAPDSVISPSRPAAVSGRELNSQAAASWSLTEQAALQHRTERFREAVLLLEQSLRADGRSGTAVLNWLWLSLAHHRLEAPSESHRWLVKAGTWLDAQEGELSYRAQAQGFHLHNWLEAHVLRREMESLVQSSTGR